LDNKVTEYFIDRLKKYIVDPDYTDVEIALIDKDMYIPNAILSHRFVGDKEQVSKLLFKVNWVGYDPEVVSELVWKEMRNNRLMHPYFDLHPQLEKFRDNIAHARPVAV
jgi:hypothetical protein